MQKRNSEKSRLEVSALAAAAPLANKSQVFFTGEISGDGLLRIYSKISQGITGKVAIKLHSGEPHGPNILPPELPGTSKLAHLEENIAAADVELTANDLRELTDAYAKVAVQGDRLSKEHMLLIDHTV